MNKVDEILQATGLDFEIIKEPFIYPTDATLKTDYYGLRNGKTGETLNSVKAGYTVSQNRELVEGIVNTLSKYNGEINVAKGGALHGGRRVYLQLEIAGESKVGDDIVKRYITIIDSNDGTTGLSVGVGTLTMSCSNEFYKFYKSGMLKLRHTQSLEYKIKELPKLIDLALVNSIKLVETFQRWTTTPVTEKIAHDLVKELLGTNRLATEEELLKLPVKKVNTMNALYLHIQREMNNKGDNLWGLHSGVTSWTTHAKQHPKRENGHKESLTVGTNYKVADKAFKFIDALSLV